MPRGIYQHKKGYKRATFSKEWIEKLSLSHRGKPTWNKGKFGYKVKPASEERKRKIGLANSVALLGYKHTEETKEKQRKRMLGNKITVGYKHTEEAKQKISKNSFMKTLEGRKMVSERFKGEKSHLWKGGITPIHLAIRGSLEYKLWRTAVFTRDNFTCIWCKDDRGHNLEADHIKPFAYYPELRFALDNGRTLCKTCHRTTETYGIKARNK